MAESANEKNNVGGMGERLGTGELGSSSLACPAGWEFRPQQEDAVRRALAAFASGKKVVAIQGPTGSGKSLIGAAIALAMQSTYYLVPLKALQDQISADFGDQYSVFKGKSNYVCTQFPSAAALKAAPELPPYRVSEAPCQDRGMSQQRKRCREDEVCDYYLAFESAQLAPHTLMNFSLYLAWMRIKEKLPGRAPFGQRGLHVIDEAHRVEDFIRDHLTVELSTRRLAKYLNYNQTEIDDLAADNLQEFLKDMVVRNDVQLADLRKQHGIDLEAVATEIDSDRLDFHLKLGERLEKYFAEADNYTFSTEEKFISGGKNKYIIVKPLFVGGYIAANVLGQQTLLLSATLPKRTVNQMGLKDEDFEYIDLPSTFPAKNRLIKFRGVGKINKETMEGLVPKLARETEKVLDQYATSKGIIHANSYVLSKLLVAELNPKYLPRLLIQDKEGETAKEILEAHTTSTEPTVILSPGMKEGIDLKNDLSRFQIILKCPYPNLGDPAVKAMAAKDHLWYVTKTIVDFMQMYGRSIRSADDFAETIVLDDNMRILIADFKFLVPKYIMEAIKWAG